MSDLSDGQILQHCETKTLSIFLLKGRYNRILDQYRIEEGVALKGRGQICFPLGSFGYAMCNLILLIYDLKVFLMYSR